MKGTQTNMNTGHITYMHQIIADTGRNKPFEPRIVMAKLTHEQPECFNFMDHYICECTSGPFAGEAGTGDTAEDAVHALRWTLMDRSRKEFNPGPSVPSLASMMELV